MPTWLIILITVLILLIGSTGLYYKYRQTSSQSKTSFILWHKKNKRNSVFNTLACWEKMLCSSQHMLQQEIEHIRKALYACNFTSWALNSLLTKFNHKHNIYSTQTVNSDQHSNSSNNNISIVVPYTKSLSERFKKTSNNLGIQAQHHQYSIHGP